MEELFEELRSLRVIGAHKNYSRMVTILQIPVVPHKAVAEVSKMVSWCDAKMAERTH